MTNPLSGDYGDYAAEIRKAPRIRIELESALKIDMKTGKTHEGNIARVWLSDWESERTRWRKAIGGGHIAATETTTEPSYADLLESIARILRAEQ
jgi:hypothetical protein